jgi:hypothetical protein
VLSPSIFFCKDNECLSAEEEEEEADKGEAAAEKEDEEREKEVGSGIGGEVDEVDDDWGEGRGDSEVARGEMSSTDTAPPHPWAAIRKSSLEL